MNIDLYTYSGRGGRPINEDSFGCGEGYFIVSDGLGGHEHGEAASYAAVSYISENFRSDMSAEASAGLLVAADDAVRRLGSGGKATVAAVFTDNDKLRIANVGDSRVYYFRRRSVFFRTKDHSVCQASVDMGEMTDDEVRHSADRSGLLKVLGDTEPLRLPKPYDLIDPQDGDAFLICSHGFWEHIYDMEMEADLLKSGSSREWLEHMLKRLLLRSENKGDNFTAVCGIIHAPDKLPRTTPITKNITAEIPITQELEPSPAAHVGKKKLVAACVIAAVVVVIAAIAAVLIYNIAGIGEDPDSSSASEDSSFVASSPSDEPDSSGDSDLSSDSDSSSDTDSSSNTDSSGDTESSSETDSSGDIDSSGDTDSSSDPVSSEESDETQVIPLTI